jgi:hypothetical protein
MKVGLICNSSL